MNATISPDHVDLGGEGEVDLTAAVEFSAQPNRLPCPAFFEHLLSSNPFTLQRAVVEGGATLDAELVHDTAVTRLKELAHDAARLRRGLGVLLTGAAGSGKSHVLDRLARWSADDKAFFVAIDGLRIDPTVLYAVVLRAVANRLIGTPDEPSWRIPLFRLLKLAVKQAAGDEEQFVRWSRLGRVFARMADKLLPSARLSSEGRAAFELLFRYFRSASRAAHGKEDGHEAVLIRRWLAGESLSALDARELDLQALHDTAGAITLNDASRCQQMLATLAALASAIGQPLILAFDGVEMLESSRFISLMRNLVGLLDATPGLLTVTAGDPAALRRWRAQGEVPQSAWDRVGQFEVALGALTVSEATALVRRRLDEALAPFEHDLGLATQRANAPLFPLHANFGSGVWRARSVLEAAREAWVIEQSLLRESGPAGWLAAWSERQVAVKAPEETRIGIGERSLTLEQLRAAIANRGRPAPAAAPIAPSVVGSPSPPTVSAAPIDAPPVERPVPPAEIAAALPVVEIPIPPVETAASATSVETETPAAEPEKPPVAIAVPQPPVGEDPPTLLDPDLVASKRRPAPATSVPAASEPVVAAPQIAPPVIPAATAQESLIDRAVASAVAAYVAARPVRPELLADAEQVAELTQALLLQCQEASRVFGIEQVEKVPAWKAALPACDLLLKLRDYRGTAIASGILVLTTSRATAISGFLRRLTTEPQPFERLLLVTEANIAMPLGPRGREYLEELQTRTSFQLRMLELSGAEYISLSALRAVARQGKGGGLIAEGNRITESEVVASLHRQGRYHGSRYLSAILSDAPTTETIANIRAAAPLGNADLAKQFEEGT